MARKFKPITIDKFKGVNARRPNSSSASSFESYGIKDAEAAEMSNWNVSPDGYLERRAGAQLLVQINRIGTGVSGPAYTPTQLRVIGSMRVGQANTKYVFVSDQNHTWRIDVSTGAFKEVVKDGTEAITGSGVDTPVVNIRAIGNQALSPAVYDGYAVTNSGQAWGTGGYMGITATKGTGTGPVANTPYGYNGFPFKSRFWVWHVRGLNGDETKLWFSNPGDYANFGGAGMPNNLVFDFADGDYITWVQPYNDQLVVFKTKKTYVLSPEGDPTAWTTRLVSDRVGCVAGNSVKAINGFLYFLSADGVYKTDGTTFQMISEPIRDLVDMNKDYSLPTTGLDTYASYWDNKYILWLPRYIAVSNYRADQAFVYDLATEVWVVWDLKNTVGVAGEARFAEMASDRLVVGGIQDTGGVTRGDRVWYFGTAPGGHLKYSDNDQAFDCTWLSKKMTFGSPTKKKRVFQVQASVKDDVTTVGTYRIRCVADDATTNPVNVGAPFEAPAKYSVNMIQQRGPGYGRYFQTRITANSTEYSALYDVTWQVEERGDMPGDGPNINTAPPALP